MTGGSDPSPTSTPSKAYTGAPATRSQSEVGVGPPMLETEWCICNKANLIPLHWKQGQTQEIVSERPIGANTWQTVLFN
jgi:hypothetical protein